MDFARLAVMDAGRPVRPASIQAEAGVLGSQGVQPYKSTLDSSWSGHCMRSPLAATSQTAAAQSTLLLAAGSAALLASSTRRRRQQQRWHIRATASTVQAALADEFLDFVGRTGSPAHTVEEARKRLETAGFVRLADGKAWHLERGGKYYVTYGGTSICAFAVGGSFDVERGGAVIAAAHTDSPCLKLRPCSKMPSKAGTLQLGVETYGGGLWHTWFDRPLGVAGKVVLESSGGLEERLVRITEPICIIPNLAIHLQTPEERKAFSPNKETELQPVLCAPCGGTDGAPAQPSGGSPTVSAESAPELKIRHPQELIDPLASALSVEAKDILDVDLCLMDATPPCFMGQFVSTPRIDNVLSTWASIDGLASFAEDKQALQDSCDLLVAASFDHEEVGSTSTTGADSQILERWLGQALQGLGGATWQEVVSRSFLLSCDCAHGLHPNYMSKHQAEHQPILGKGIVIKTNSNQRYATTPLLAQMVRQVCKASDAPAQEFVVRNDCPCGSTIGPLLSAQLGVRTVDVGAPQWAMHSCRETAHCDDVAALRDLCLGVFKHFRTVDASTTAL
eukprot:TRINITY_DN16626_c0_g2_i1.p1 TRINITY_DN16626_c0_g2~~TRINITY_DN16626_c0_g2_i1.p1  ORF type:complete len:565 (-),score=101.81 TRINITY_DN16626_c0_g2_i1:103-1797(-)